MVCDKLVLAIIIYINQQYLLEHYLWSLYLTQSPSATASNQHSDEQRDRP